MHTVEQTGRDYVRGSAAGDPSYFRDIGVRGACDYRAFVRALIEPVIRSADLTIDDVSQRRQDASVNLSVAFCALGKASAKMHVVATGVKLWRDFKRWKVADDAA